MQEKEKEKEKDHLIDPMERVQKPEMGVVEGGSTRYERGSVVKEMRESYSTWFDEWSVETKGYGLLW